MLRAPPAASMLARLQTDRYHSTRCLLPSDRPVRESGQAAPWIRVCSPAETPLLLHRTVRVSEALRAVCNAMWEDRSTIDPPEWPIPSARVVISDRTSWPLGRFRAIRSHTCGIDGFPYGIMVSRLPFRGGNLLSHCRVLILPTLLSAHVYPWASHGE
jgi:hypothetical protein